MEAVSGASVFRRREISARWLPSGVFVLRTPRPHEFQIASVHVCLGAPEQISHLCTKFTILVPTTRHGLEAEQGLGDIAMRCTRLRSVECLQGAKLK